MVLTIKDSLRPGLSIKELIPQCGKLLKRAGSEKHARFRSAEESHGVAWLPGAGRAELAANVQLYTPSEEKDGFRLSFHAQGCSQTLVWVRAGTARRLAEDTEETIHIHRILRAGK